MHRVFTIDIDGTPAMALNASNLSHAHAICAFSDFRLDLKGLTSGGTRFCTDDSSITARPANDAEVSAFAYASSKAPLTDEITFVFLLDIDRGILDRAIVQLRHHKRC